MNARGEDGGKNARRQDVGIRLLIANVSYAGRQRSWREKIRGPERKTFTAGRCRSSPPFPRRAANWRLFPGIQFLPILMQNLTVRGSSNSNSNVICSCNCTGSQPQGMDISELEFVQIIIIIVVMTVMIVVIVCLLNHYKLSTWSLITRHSQSRRQEEALRPDGCAWPSDSLVSQHGASEMMYGARSRERFAGPSFTQRERPSRFQPTYPYLQHQIDLPPTIALSDGEEPPPYLGPCKLQLRDPEQQMELNRESVRAPPNRTVYDSELIGGPRPPSSNSGVSATNSAGHGRMEGPPPAYCEVVGRHPGSSSSSSSSSSSASIHQHSNNPPSALRPGSRTVSQSRNESTIVLIKAKESRRDKLV